MTVTGVSTNDFAQILSDYGVGLTYYVNTKTIDPLTGDETDTFSSSSVVTAIFFLQDQRYLFDKEGLLEVGDAYIMAPIATGIKRYDQFASPEGDTYYIEKVVRRTVAGTDMMDYGTCFQVK